MCGKETGLLGCPADRLCQQLVSTTRTHQCTRTRRRPLGRCPYNSRTTRRAPTGSYQRIRRGGTPVPIHSFIRDDADERPPTPTGVGALITRRSQVQILPPPPDERPGRMAWAFDVAGGASPTTTTGSCLHDPSSWCFAACRPVDVYRLAVATNVAKRSAAAPLMPRQQVTTRACPQPSTQHPRSADHSAR